MAEGFLNEVEEMRAELERVKRDRDELGRQLDASRRDREQLVRDLERAGTDLARALADARQTVEQRNTIAYSLEAMRAELDRVRDQAEKWRRRYYRAKVIVEAYLSDGDLSALVAWGEGRPMEEAPRDGTRILVRIDGIDNAPGFIADVQWRDGAWWDYHDCGFCEFAVCWWPLPSGGE